MMIESFIERVWNTWLAGGWTMIPLAALGLMTYAAAVRMFLYFSQRMLGWASSLLGLSAGFYNLAIC